MSCPTRMNDGRAFTDYRPRCMMNDDLMAELNKQKMVASSYESRMYLQNNAEVIMEQQKKSATDKLMCGTCPMPIDSIGTMHNEKYVVRCDTVTCGRQEVDPNGLGDGRNYNY